MKNILFPTDFSEASDKAFIYALHLADKWKATITTLHIYQKPQLKSMSLPHTLEDFYGSFDLYELEGYRDYIPRLMESVNSNGFRHIEIQHILEQGEVKEKIIELAKREAADLIVMGTTGARGLKGVLLGSVAGAMLIDAPCPVLAVPKDNVFDGELDQIAFTTSYRDDEKGGLELLRKLTADFSPEIHCVNVDLAHTHEIHNPMEEWKMGIEADENLHFEILDGTDLYKAMTVFMDKNHIDMITMVTHKRSWLQELFTYSHAKKMSYHSKTPVLALPEGMLT